MAAITLKRPIVHDGKTIESLDLDPTIGAVEIFEQMLKAGVSEMEALLPLLADASGLPIEAVRMIRVSDLTEARAALEGSGPLEASPSGEAGDA